MCKNSEVKIIKRESNSNTPSYTVKLSNNLIWSFSSETEELKPWLKRIGVIFELDNKPFENGFQEENITAHNEDNGETSNIGWQRHDMVTFNASYDIENRKILYSINPFSRKNDEIIAIKSAFYPIYREIIDHGGQLFHAALIERDGKGVLLAGKSGVGKSTACRRLPEHWNVLCDDELLMIPTEQGIYRAHPLPTWSEYIMERSEKTWNIHYSAPVYGIFFIEQSDVDSVLPLGEGQSVAQISESAYQAYRSYWEIVKNENKKLLQRKMFHNSIAMAKNIPVFKLRVSLHGCFWEEIERALGW